ncbi:uncharacterized protein LOC143896303 isoform X2 [Temnothorax americanus]|uniref:uncharacterized protein LOC143896303 isoform X2 n=1 Tax=Temnothorax americanus TaxID=1964332 RepID=UPI00406975F0
MLASRMSVRTSRECVADYRTEIGLVEAAGDRNDAAARIYWILLWSCRRGTLKNCRSRYFTSARIGYGQEYHRPLRRKASGVETGTGEKNGGEKGGQRGGMTVPREASH